MSEIKYCNACDADSSDTEMEVVNGRDYCYECAEVINTDGELCESEQRIAVDYDKMCREAANES